MIAQNLHKYIKSKNIPLVVICEKTGLTPNQVYPSIRAKPKRVLKADELILICQFLEINPMQLSKTEKTKAG